jgi:signal transduction histidine kinase
MKRLQQHLLLPLTIIAFVAALGLGLLTLSREIETTQQSLRTGNWMAVQIEIEFQRFLKALARYGLNDSDISFATLNQRLDILWSRLLLTESGPASSDLRDDTQFVAVTAELSQALQRVEPFLKELSKGDEAAYRTILAELAPFEPGLHQLVQHLIMQSDQLARSGEMQMRYWEIVAAYAGLVLTGGLLIAVLLRERRRANRLLAEADAARARAERDSRAKTTFLATMSHELRTPLNAVIGFSEMIKAQVFGQLNHPRYAEYVDFIHKSGAHLLELINSILDISKIESGGVVATRSEVDVNQLALVCAGLIEPRARDKGILVLRHLDAHLPHLWSDERLLRQVLLNLLSNAVKFTPEHGRVELVTGLDEARRPFLRVRDNGIGIAPKDMERIFKPFVQIDSDLNRRYTGSGLGLSISKAYADTLDGELQISSTEGGGTTVTLILPAADVIPAARTREAALA